MDKGTTEATPEVASPPGIFVHSVGAGLKTIDFFIAVSTFSAEGCRFSCWRRNEAV